MKDEEKIEFVGNKKITTIVRKKVFPDLPVSPLEGEYLAGCFGRTQFIYWFLLDSIGYFSESIERIRSSLIYI